VRVALDTNILSGLWSRKPLGSQISSRLKGLQVYGGLVICGPVYIELYANPNITAAFIDEFLVEAGIAVDFNLEEEVWRLAAHAFAAYASRRKRSGGGTPKRLPVDFLIASHASLQADGLMTLDAGSYQLDFPKLKLFGL
jgi:predicted nucleic acid-binding protein